MKRVKKYGMVFFMLAVSISCVKTDDFELPVISTPQVNIEGNLTSIVAVKGHYNVSTGGIYTFQNTNSFFEGVVVSSDEGGNFYKRLVIQDRAVNPTAGIQLLVDETSLSSTYNFGRKIYVRLDGLSLGYSNGVLQLGRQNRGDVVAISPAIIDDHIIRTAETVAVTPLPLEIDAFHDRYKNLYIKLNEVQFNRNLVREDRRYSFSAENFDRFDGERQIESCRNGAISTLSTSTYADFRSMLLPVSSGSISGILTRNYYDDYFVVVINSPEALDFNDGGRCDPTFLNCGTNTSMGQEIVFEESFETITTQRMLETRGWYNMNTSGGSKRFEPGTQAGNRHVRITAYNTQEVPLEAWLVTPAIDLLQTRDEVLSFDVRASFDNATILRVYVTNEFTGNPQTTNWSLVDANIPIGPSNQNAVHFTRSFIDISCLEGTIHVAFRYLGAAGEKSTTYDIDNVRVTGL